MVVCKGDKQILWQGLFLKYYLDLLSVHFESRDQKTEIENKALTLLPTAANVLIFLSFMF